MTIIPWDWTQARGQVSQEIMLKAYNALTTGGLINDFSYLVWNEIVKYFYEILQNLGQSWYSETPFLSYNDTLLTDTDKILTAQRFNTLMRQLPDYHWAWWYSTTKQEKDIYLDIKTELLSNNQLKATPIAFINNYTPNTLYTGKETQVKAEHFITEDTLIADSSMTDIQQYDTTKYNKLLLHKLNTITQTIYPKTVEQSIKAPDNASINKIIIKPIKYTLTNDEDSKHIGSYIGKIELYTYDSDISTEDSSEGIIIDNNNNINNSNNINNNITNFLTLKNNPDWFIPDKRYFYGYTDLNKIPDSLYGDYFIELLNGANVFASIINKTSTIKYSSAITNLKLTIHTTKIFKTI